MKKFFPCYNICDENEEKRNSLFFGECILAFIIELALCQAVFHAYFCSADLVGGEVPRAWEELKLKFS
jgi:hypothetical protein